MRRTFAFLGIILSVHLVSTRLLLTGQFGEYNGLPVNIRCQKKLGYVRLGGITVNNRPLNQLSLKNAKEQCEDQMNAVAEKRKYLTIGKGTSGAAFSDVTTCTLTLPEENVNATDIVRVVFSCHDSKPSGSPGWGKEKANPPEEALTSEQKNADANVLLECHTREVIIVKKVRVNGSPVDELAFPDLQPSEVSKRCFQYIHEYLKSGKVLDNPFCNILNKKSYGGKLSIDYLCMSPGSSK